MLAGLDPVIKHQDEECVETLSLSPSETSDGGGEGSVLEAAEAGETGEASLQQGGSDYYKTMKTGENMYSYAYRDAFSPAALIKLEDCSDVSEEVYDSIKAPSEISKVDVMSDTMSDKGDLFFSIRCPLSVWSSEKIFTLFSAARDGGTILGSTDMLAGIWRD